MLIAPSFRLPQALGQTASPTFAGLTLSGLTAGSVPFAGASGLISQDNSKLYWDNSGKRLGIGRQPTAYTLEVGGNLQVTGENIYGSSSNQYVNLDDLGYAGIYTGTSYVSISSVGTGYVRFTSNGVIGGQMFVNKNWCLGGFLGAGTGAVSVVVVPTGTAPSTSPADAFQMYSADQAAGNACLHARTENGTVIKLYQQAVIASPAADATELKTAVDAIRTLLVNNGLMAAA